MYQHPQAVARCPLRYYFIQYRNADGRNAFTSTMAVTKGDNPLHYTTKFVRDNFIALHETDEAGAAVARCCS